MVKWRNGCGKRITNTLKEYVIRVIIARTMSQKVIYDILKNDLNGAGTSASILKILKEKHPEVSSRTVIDKLTRLRKWGAVGYTTHTKTWSITGDYD